METCTVDTMDGAPGGHGHRAFPALCSPAPACTCLHLSAPACARTCIPGRSQGSRPTTQVDLSASVKRVPQHPHGSRAPAEDSRPTREKPASLQAVRGESQGVCQAGACIVCAAPCRPPLCQLDRLLAQGKQPSSIRLPVSPAASCLGRAMRPLGRNERDKTVALGCCTCICKMLVRRLSRGHRRSNSEAAGLIWRVGRAASPAHAGTSAWLHRRHYGACRRRLGEVMETVDAQACSVRVCQRLESCIVCPGSPAYGNEASAARVAPSGPQTWPSFTWKAIT